MKRVECIWQNGMAERLPLLVGKAMKTSFPSINESDAREITPSSSSPLMFVNSMTSRTHCNLITDISSIQLVDLKIITWRLCVVASFRTDWVILIASVLLHTCSSGIACGRCYEQLYDLCRGSSGQMEKPMKIFTCIQWQNTCMIHNIGM